MLKKNLLLHFIIGFLLVATLSLPLSGQGRLFDELSVTSSFGSIKDAGEGKREFGITLGINSLIPFQKPDEVNDSYGFNLATHLRGGIRSFGVGGGKIRTIVLEGGVGPELRTNILRIGIKGFAHLPIANKTIGQSFFLRDADDYDKVYFSAMAQAYFQLSTRMSAGVEGSLFTTPIATYSIHNGSTFRDDEQKAMWISIGLNFRLGK